MKFTVVASALFITLNHFLVMHSLIARMPSLEETNKRADMAFLEWKIHAQSPELSPELRALLESTEARAFVVNESQMSLIKPNTSLEFKEKIKHVSDAFFAKFDPKNTAKGKRAGMQILLRSLIEPEYIFQINKPLNRREQIYNSFLQSMADVETPIKTTLSDWTLRFLMSESLEVALSIIEKARINNTSFNDLLPAQRKQIVEIAADIVTNRFFNNLKPIKDKFNIELPLGIEEAIGYKISTFLKEKFLAV